MRVLITGISGQDGSILFDQATAAGFDVLGIVRNKPITVSSDTLSPDSRMVDLDISQAHNARQILDLFNPSLILHMAAIHASSERMNSLNGDTLVEMKKCHVEITKNIIDWQVRNPKSKSIIALSSQMYSPKNDISYISEESKIDPFSVYGETKARAFQIIKNARKNLRVQTAGAILFNHTSSRSKPEFLFPTLARKITDCLLGKSQVIEIRNQYSRIDITSANEICDGILKLARLDSLTDLVFSSGASYMLEDIIVRATKQLEKSFNPNIVSTFSGSMDQKILVGDPRKAGELIDWKATMQPWDILAQMVQQDLHQRST